MGRWHLFPFHLHAVWSGSPYGACCPRHLNCCMSQDQPLLGCSLLLLIPGAMCDKLTACGSSSNLPGASLWTILVLRHNQPQAFTKLSAPYSEGELLHQSLDMITHLAWPPSLGGFPSPSVPNLWSTFGCRYWLSLAPSPLLPSTALQEACTEGILVQSPGASFPALVQGTMLITVFPPAAWKEFAMKLRELD